MNNDTHATPALAGREMDAAVATALGWKNQNGSRYWYGPNGKIRNEPPCFSEYADTLNVAIKAWRGDLGGDIAIEIRNSPIGPLPWVVKVVDSVNGTRFRGEGETLNLAVCAAVLSWKARRA